MHVDDRLATVLGARVESIVARRIQYRQLLDLVGTSPAASRTDNLDSAFVRLAELARELAPEDRARALGEPGVRLRNPRLVADLAADAPPVALAAIRAARLDDAQWLDLIPALPLFARGLLRHRRDLGHEVLDRLERLGIGDRGLPLVEGAQATATETQPAPPVQAVAAPLEPAPEPVAKPAPPPAPTPVAATVHSLPPAGDGIGALVRRIEAFRRSRQGAAPPRAANDAPQLPLGEREIDLSPLTVFAFATDPDGRIAWTDAPVPGMLVGLAIAQAETAGPGESMAETLRRRLPLRHRKVTLAGAAAIAGEWLIEAMPDFDEAARFAGYLGRCRRPAVQAAGATTTEADRMRQVLHELKTPVNAIQGFAEVIQQQLFGPTPHEYRALAAGIAGDAARLLAGFDELDRWARLDAGVLEPEPGACDFAMVVAGLVHQLEGYTAGRSSGFTLEADPGELRVALAPAEGERLAWRLLASCAGFARPGEILALALRREAGRICLTAVLPEALGAITAPADAPTAATAQAISAGIFGTAFTFRLLAAEARRAGGQLAFAGGTARLELPEAKPAEAAPAHPAPEPITHARS
ncbi:histidine kinase dimerization/phospho-acceptor domain-containing protein [Novosphingobium bradum]|uniref:histidine kinase n=1 Tax=Novosphingobium bradum TaxID=1737444 RepID=A0ABV7IPL6_9SPHN